MALLTFEQALEESGETTKNLLLGNGFSISCRPGIFTYDTIFDQTNFEDTPEIREVFNEFEIRDFEAVIRLLQDSSRIVRIYDQEATELMNTVTTHADLLKELLVRTLTDHHPDNVGSISEEEYRSAGVFLSHFLRDPRHGNVYTFNYDLLLYWTSIHALNHAQSVGIPGNSVNDGFGDAEEDEGEEFVAWRALDPTGQRIHYLHGALHLVDTGTQLRKYAWSRTGIPLMDQIRAALEEELFPLFVAEGERQQKVEKIRKNVYLHHALKSFKSVTRNSNRHLFIHGHSLSGNDDHVLRLVGKGRNPKVFVSLYGDMESDENQQIVERAYRLAQLRENRYPVGLFFYDAASAHVWDRFSEAEE